MHISNDSQTSAHNGDVLRGEALTKTFGSTTAVDEATLTVHAGESLAVMGPSGSGKTTLMHMLSGIMAPDRGRALFTSGGRPAVDIASLGPEDRARLRRDRIGFVFQEGLLLPELTALENVAVAQMVSGTSRRAAESEADQWLVSLGLDGMQNHRPGQLSGGQAQRVAIARSQVTRPDIVFADEPTGSLDSRTSQAVLDALLGSTVDRGAPLVVVTHDESVAARCRRLVRLQDGRVVHDAQQNPRQSPEQNPQEVRA